MFRIINENKEIVEITKQEFLAMAIDDLIESGIGEDEHWRSGFYEIFKSNEVIDEETIKGSLEFLLPLLKNRISKVFEHFENDS